MNENKFLSQSAVTRVKYSPLRLSCVVSCRTPLSPMTQVLNAAESAGYEPDRSLSPCIIIPEVRAFDPDGVFSSGVVNNNLTLDALTWTIATDGGWKPLGEVWTEGADFEVDTSSTATRGSLTIYKNIPVTDKAALRFSGKFLDWRTNIVYNVESNEAILTTTDKGVDIMKCHVDKSTIVYDPALDGLLLYDYKVARGISVGGASRESFIDGKCYLQTVNVLLTVGVDACETLPDGVTMELVALGSETPLVAGATANPWLVECGYPDMTFDMRLIDKAEFEVRFKKDGEVKTHAAFGMHSKCSMPTSASPTSGVDIRPSTTTYRNSALVNNAFGKVGYPEVYYLLEWFTQSRYHDGVSWKWATAKEWQRGEKMEAPVSDIGIGEKYDDSVFQVWFELSAHEKLDVATDESGEILTDENNEILLI